MKNLHSVNKQHGMFVFNNNGHVSCLGFDVVLDRAKGLAKELGVAMRNFRRGSKAGLEFYNRMVLLAKKRHDSTGWRSASGLFAPFIGNEGKRVEVTYSWGERERFYIGKSTGWIPCHIAVKRRGSSGGCAVLSDSIKEFRFLN